MVDWNLKFLLILGMFIFHSGPSDAYQINNEQRATPKKISLQLRWLHQFQFAGYYMALEKGFYLEEGIDLEIIVGGPGETGPIDSVMSGDADFSISTSEALHQSLNGKPLMAVAAILQHSPLIFMAKKEIGIKTPHDLVGKTVMTLEGLSNVSLIAMLKNEGVNLEDINFVPQSFDLNDLINDRVDAISAYQTNQPLRLAMLGIETISLNPQNYGIDFYGDVIFGKRETILENVESTAGFVRATVKGWEYALENIDETIAIIQNVYGSSLSKEVLAFEAEEIRKLMLVGVVEVGHMNEGRFNRMTEIFIEQGMAPTNASVRDFVFNPEKILQNRQNKLIRQLSIALGGLTLVLFSFFLYSWWLKQKQLESRKFSDAKSKFLTQVSHEFRTPLNAIMGFSEFINKEMAGKIENEKYKEYAQIIYKSGNHLLTLINDLNDLTKLQSGKMKIRKENFVLKNLLNDAVSGFELEAKNSGISIIVDPMDESLNVLGDKDLMFQVFLNLISNACKFTDVGGKIAIKTLIDTDGGLEILIMDNGVGIKPENMDVILENFGQLPSPFVKLEVPGTGLGLSLVDSLVSLHNGEFSLSSVWGKGTTARIKLPASRVKRIV